MHNSLKRNFGHENYILLLKEQYYIPLFKFRTVNHKLLVETGRWDGTALLDRKCVLCNLSTIGSEQHYLLECNYFNESRNKYLRHLNTEFNDYKYRPTLLITSNSQKVQDNIYQFVKIIIKDFQRK